MSWSNPVSMLTARVRHKLRLKRDYDDCFKGPGGTTETVSAARVLKDIAQFCGAYKTTARTTATASIDPIAMAMAEGRRQVWLHIQGRLRLTDNQILDLVEEAKND